MRAARIVLTVAALAVGIGVGWIAATRWAVRGHDASGTAPAGTVTATAPPAGERRVLYWYDPMVPTQKFDKPGKSPFMDMQLVPRYADEVESAAGADATSGLTVSTQAQQALGLRTAKVERRSVGATTEAVGTVQLSERDISIVQARTAGFVERTYGRAPGDVIAAGAPLVDLLNPEWLGAQQEYLAVRALGDAALSQAARARLNLLGMPAALIERVERSGQPLALHTITAPSAGVITELAVRDGMTVSPGMTLARINGLATVWLEAAVPEAQAPTVRPGQAVEARFPALAGERVRGRVATILPQANPETRTLRVRIELPNPGQRLRAGLFAQVSFGASAAPALVVPAEAVIRTGRRAIVYLAEAAGRFRPVEVEIGEQFGEDIVIRSGLSEGQQVVTSGQFLLDSEASLQGVMARGAASAAPAAPGATGAQAAPAAPPSAGSTSPAAEHRTRGSIVSIEDDTITLDHEPVPALKWPSMTMPFKLSDRRMARGLKKGQSVDFSFRQNGDDYLVTRIAPAPAAGAAR